MSGEQPAEGLRLLARLIAADLRAGSLALADEQEPQPQTRRGRKATKVTAVAAHRAVERAA